MARKPETTLLSARHRPDTTWHGTAFVVEALVLLVFLTFAIAVLMQLFGSAHARGLEERSLTQAVALATNDAEAFAAAPQADLPSSIFDADGNPLSSADAEEVADTFVVTRKVTPEIEPSGTLYRASIVVARDGETVYELDTARYVSAAASSNATPASQNTGSTTPSGISGAKGGDAA
ncbi:MAG: hypothetical protein RRZ85_03130 [Gordonibacter sp.]|uniref:hypothetical protein n=1 Tax=Gordonibacter sp. TaxID=1968902 RepID=UPI002FC60177